MSSLAGSEFEKGRQCPSSEVLLSYRQPDLTRGQTSQVASHLDRCEFCSAELQLLSKYPSTRESHESPPMPENLRALAEALLTRNRFAAEPFLEKMF